MRERAFPLALLLLSLAPPGADATVPDFVRAVEWVEVRGTGFTVLTDAGARVGLDVASKLERFSSALTAINPGLGGRSRLPTAVYVFRDQAELDGYRPEESEAVDAFFTAAQDRNLLVLNGTPGSSGRAEVVFHEYVHCHLAANFPTVPLWVNEGLAGYYSTCRLRGSTAEFGSPNKDIVAWMRDRRPIELQLMFAMTPEAPAYRKDNELRNQFYAQSYVLTHMLQSPAQDRAARFDRFLATLRRGAEPVKAFREQFPTAEWSELTAGLAGHLEGIDFEPLRRIELPPAVGGAAERVVPPAEALTRLGELLLVLGPARHESAVDHLRAALEADPQHGPAHAALGLASDLDRRTAEAEGHYARAVAFAPRDPRVFVTAGRGTMRRLVAHLEAGAPRESVVTTGHLARERYAACLRLDASDLEALGGRGATYALLGESADSSATRGLERAVEALPARHDLAAALAVLRAREGRSVEAQALVRERVEPAAGAASATMTRSALGEVEVQRALALAREGRWPEAESILVRVADGHEDPNVRELARSRLEVLKTGLASDQAVAQVNEAMRIANEGRLEEARDRLVALRGQPGAGAIRGDVERLIHELEAEARLRRAGKLIQGNQLAEAEALLAGAGGSWPDSSYERRGRSALNEVRARRQIEQALALVKAGKLDEARAAFARVLEMDVAAPVKDYARQRVRDLDSARSRKP